MKKRSGFKVMMRLSGLVKPLSGYMCLAIMMGVIGNLCASFITIFGAYMILNILGIYTSLSLGFMIAIILVFAIARGLLRYGEQSCNHYIAFRLLALIRDHVFKALRRLCPAKLEGKDKGDLISVITSDIELLEVFYAHTISPVCIAIIFSLFMVIFIGSQHIVAGIIALCAYLVVGLVIPLVVSHLSGDTGLNFRRKSGNLSAFVLDSLRGINEIMQYNKGEDRVASMNEQVDALSEDEKKMKDDAGRNQAVTNGVILFADVVMLMAMSALCISGETDFGALIISAVSLMSSFGPVVALANLGSTLQNTFAAGNRVLDILDETPVTEEITGRREVSFDSAEVKNVSFAYGEEQILDDISLSIEKGTITGIAGKSGSGKSTLLKLLMRFWDTQKGSVRISDTDVRDINTDNLRNMESYVTQETHMFHDSIRNNIRIAKPDASDDEIVEACKKASIHDFIMSLPKGYDTTVGELGDTLSGGEKQRIGVARAFLHDAPFILLDEPTSNLDSLNEAIILKSLREEKENRTVVLVSHRESTLRIADKVYSVTNGRMS